MKHTYTKAFSLALALVAIVASSGTAFADNDHNKGIGSMMREIKMVKVQKENTPKPEVSINSNGTSVVQSAVVTGVSGSTYTATTTLGTAVLTWNITTDSATQFLNRGGKVIVASDIVVGDVINVRGTFVTGSTLALKATSLRDMTKVTVVTPPVVSTDRQIFEGYLSVVPGATVPTTATVVINGANQTISISAATAILNKDWAGTSLTAFQANDVVRVFGYIPAGSSAVTALVLRNTTR